MFRELIKNIRATEDDGYMMAPKVENTNQEPPTVSACPKARL